jgi:hypothetical protein
LGLLRSQIAKEARMLDPVCPPRRMRCTAFQPRRDSPGTASGSSSASSTKKTRIDWYRFARDTLGYGHNEAVAYANVRYVEEMNRNARRSRAA